MMAGNPAAFDQTAHDFAMARAVGILEGLR